MKIDKSLLNYKDFLHFIIEGKLNASEANLLVQKLNTAHMKYMDIKVEKLKFPYLRDYLEIYEVVITSITDPSKLRKALLELVPEKEMEKLLEEKAYKVIFPESDKVMYL